MVLIDLKYLGYAVQELAFPLMDQPVGLGDVEQTIENIFQHHAVRMAGAAQLRHAPCINFEPRDILLGDVVETRHVARLLRGHFEDFLERTHLVLGDDAVGLGHLGRERYHRDGKRDATAKIRIA